MSHQISEGDLDWIAAGRIEQRDRVKIVVVSLGWSTGHGDIVVRRGDPVGKADSNRHRAAITDPDSLAHLKKYEEK